MVNVNFTQINVFIHVAETLNFSETAQKLHLTQPAVTKNIQQLESELENKLFNRKKNGVTLTPEGEYFYRNMTDIMLRLEQTITQVRDRKFITNLNLGYTNTPFEKRFIPELLTQLAELSPAVKVNLRNFNLNSGIDDLLSHRLDLLLTTPDNVATNRKIAFVPILKSEFKVLLPIDYQLANREELTINDLTTTEIILFNPRQSPPAIESVQNELRNLTNQSNLTVAETANILVTLVKGQQGVGILPSFVIDQTDTEMAIIPLKNKATVTYGVAYRRDDDRSEIQALIKLIEEIITKFTY